MDGLFYRLGLLSGTFGNRIGVDPDSQEASGIETLVYIYIYTQDLRRRIIEACGVKPACWCDAYLPGSILPLQEAINMSAPLIAISFRDVLTKSHPRDLNPKLS